MHARDLKGFMGNTRCPSLQQLRDVSHSAAVALAQECARAVGLESDLCSIR